MNPSPVIIVSENPDIRIIGRVDESFLTDEIAQRQKEKKYLSDLFKIKENNIFFLKQTHGIDFHFVEGKTSDTAYYAEGDALATSEANQLLVVRTADCLPVFFSLYKEKKPVGGGIIHAGWKGLHLGIIPAMLNASINHYDADAVTCYLGPCIGKKNYEVGIEVAEKFEEVENRNGKYYLDIPSTGMNQIQFLEKKRNDIQFQYFKEYAHCTFENNNRYYSHRKKDSGRNLNTFILRKT